MKHQEEAIARVVSLLKSWQDLFEGGGGLINVASGVLASDSVRHDLLLAAVIGESALHGGAVGRGINSWVL